MNESGTQYMYECSDCREEWWIEYPDKNPPDTIRCARCGMIMHRVKIAGEKIEGEKQ